ncbi:MAG: hypothetical protein GY725_01885 [bacterium]|nr:hypothetical protein [bacterium]
MHGPTPPDSLQIEGSCPECAAPFRATIWDHHFHCAYCGSLLVSARELNTEVFIAGDRPDTPSDVRELLLFREVRDFKSSLVGRFRIEDGLEIEPPWVEEKVRVFAEQLRRELVVEEEIDFFAPYEIHEQTVAQGILGRRGRAKESFVQGFDVEDIKRLYDAGEFNLRDRGLKIRGMHMQLISDAHLACAENRFLTVVEQPEPSLGERRNASKVRPRNGISIVTMIDSTVRERRFRVYKHMTYVRTRRSAHTRHLLFDRQFDTLAGELQSEEVEGFRSIPSVATSSVLTRPEIRAIASECPNCGWDLDLPERERIVFCPTCALGIAVTPTGLESISYRVGTSPPESEADSVLYCPFWAFDFSLRVEEDTFERIWDWLERVSPQAVARQFQQTDPERSQFLIPARNLYGNELLDDIFAQLTGWANWSQPELSSDRPNPDSRAHMLGVELDAKEAAGLARFALLALHDVQSTRRLNGMNFRAFIGDAELHLGQATLVSLPLEIRENVWCPKTCEPSDQPGAYRRIGSTLKGFSSTLLTDESIAPRETKHFSLF